MRANEARAIKLTAVCTLVAAVAAMVFSVAAGSAKAPHVVYVTSVSLSKASVAPGASLEVTHRVRNRGSHKSGRRTVRFYLTLTEDAARGLKGTSLGTSKTSRIPGKTTRSFRKTVTVPANTPGGAYLVTACIAGECQATSVRVVIESTPVAPGADLGDPDLTIDPSEWAFSELPPGYEETKNFTVTNIGSGASGTIAMSISGELSGVFSIVEDSCTGIALAPQSSCMVTVHYGSNGSEVSGHLDVTALPGAPPETVFAALSAPPGT